MEFYLAIDQGTHASRALLFDESGNQIASKWSKVGLTRRQDGWIEQDALELIDSVFEVVHGLLKACSPVLSWQDVRGADFLTSIKAAHPKIQAMTGLPVSAHYGASKLRWLTQNLPQQNNASCWI